MKLTKIGPDQFEIVQPTCIMDQVSVSPVSVGSDLHLPKFWPTLKAESATLQAAENFRAKTVRSTSFDDFCYILISLFSVIIEGREVKNLVIILAGNSYGRFPQIALTLVWLELES